VTEEREEEWQCGMGWAMGESKIAVSKFMRPGLGVGFSRMGDLKPQQSTHGCKIELGRGR